MKLSPIMRNPEIKEVLWKKITGDPLNQEEQDILDRWLAESVHNRKVFAEITDNDKRLAELKFLYSMDSQASWEKNILPKI